MPIQTNVFGLFVLILCILFILSIHVDSLLPPLAGQEKIVAEIEAE